MAVRNGEREVVGGKWGVGSLIADGERKSVFIEEKRMVFMADYCRDYV
jgi:hypothetical protein